MPEVPVVGFVAISVFIVKRRIVEVGVGRDCEGEYPLVLSKPITAELRLVGQT
jgi:hypothetical protein